MTRIKKEERGSAKLRLGNFLLCKVFVLTLILVFSPGCSRQQQKNRAVGLYVDAVMLRELDQNRRAIEKLNSAVKEDNRFWPAYSLLGDIYKDLMDYPQSATSYEKATELNPLSFKDYFNLGRVYQLMKKSAPAVKAYVRACELPPEKSAADLYPKAHLYAAVSLYELKDYNKALVYGQRASELDPNVSEAQALLGNIYDSQRDYEQAIRSYKRALDIDSNNIEVMSTLAMAYLHKEQYEPAIELLMEIVLRQPANNVAYQQLGYCHLRLNEVDAAIENYRRAIMIDDHDWQAIRGLGVAYMLKGLSSGDEQLKAKAVEQWRSSLSISPSQPRRSELIKLVQKYSKQGGQLQDDL
jgi:tetratricopeptide (TPR) repeat protein